MSVSVPYEITLLSNKKKTRLRSLFVSVPYEITLLSNLNNLRYIEKEFQYLMKLHYSQTAILGGISREAFQYLMKLHYSQTKFGLLDYVDLFQYLMKLHYSQTSNKLCHYNAQGNNIRYIYYTI